MMKCLKLPLAVLSLAALSACAGEDAEQDSYPEGTVNVVLPYSAGGVSDFGVRAITPCLEAEVGGNWIIENRPGGAGATATQEVLQADPDGYTLGVGTQSTLVTTPVVAPSAGYDYAEFTHLGQIMEFPSVILAHPDGQIQSIDDFLQAEDDVTVGTSGTQVSFSLATQQLASEGYPFTVVPFEGTSEANTAALGQNVDIRWEAIDETTLELVESGELVPLAVSTEAALDVISDVPTFDETDMPQVINTTTFYPVVAPPDTPEDIVSVLEGAVEKCVGEEEFGETIGTQAAVYAAPADLLDRLSAYQDDVEAVLGDEAE